MNVDRMQHKLHYVVVRRWPSQTASAVHLTYYCGSSVVAVYMATREILVGCMH